MGIPDLGHASIDLFYSVFLGSSVLHRLKPYKDASSPPGLPTWDDFGSAKNPDLSFRPGSFSLSPPLNAARTTQPG